MKILMKNKLCVYKYESGVERVIIHICIICSLQGISWDGPPRPTLYRFDEENKRGPLWVPKTHKKQQQKQYILQLECILLLIIMISLLFQIAVLLCRLDHLVCCFRCFSCR